MNRAWKLWAVEIAILVGALLLQQTLVRWIAIGSIRPDLPLIAIIALALRRGPVAGLYAGMAVGLTLDVYAIDALGANALSKCLVGYALGFFEEKRVKSMPAMRVVFLGMGFLAHYTIFYLASGFHAHAFWMAVFRQTLPSCVYTLLIGACVFYYTARMSHREA